MLVTWDGLSRFEKNKEEERIEFSELEKRFCGEETM